MVGNKEHVCIHEEWRETVNRRLDDVEQDTRNLKKSHSDILSEIQGLRSDLGLTQQQNGYQDKDIEQLKKDDSNNQKEQYNTLKSILGRIGLFGSGVLATLVTYFILH